MRPAFPIPGKSPLRFPAAALLCCILATGACRKASAPPDSRPDRRETKSARPGSRRPGPSFGENARALFAGLSGKTREPSAAIEAAREQCAALGEEDLAELFRLLRAGPPEGAPPSMWHLIANEVMEQLRKRNLPSLPARLFSLASDEEAPAVIRDYAAQHYMLAEQQRLRGLSRSAPDLKAETIRRILDNAAQLLAPAPEPGSTLCGTTMLALAALSESLQSEDRALLRSSAAPLLMPFLGKDSPAGTAAKVSAIQAAARIGIPEAAPRIAEIARDPEAGASERLSAVAALRYFPETADIPWLRSLAENPGRLRYAAAETLRHLAEPNLKNTR